MGARETDIQNRILAALSFEFHPRGTFMRINSGWARALRTDARIRLAPKGTADIVGCLTGCYVEVEVKTDDGEQEDSQVLRQAAVERAGGIYVLARGPVEAVDLLTAALQARGLIPPMPAQPVR